MATDRDIAATGDWLAAVRDALVELGYEAATAEWLLYHTGLVQWVAGDPAYYLQFDPVSVAAGMAATVALAVDLYGDEK